MTTTIQELSDFHRFAEGRLSLGGDASLQGLLDEWMELRAEGNSLTGLRESLDQSTAGQVQPVDQAFQEIRRKLGLSE